MSAVTGRPDPHRPRQVVGGQTLLGVKVKSVKVMRVDPGNEKIIVWWMKGKK